MSIYDFTVATADNGSQSLQDYAGKTLLIVNVASKCGLTPQYDGLEALHEAYADTGLQILGFPCNQFGAQEPGTAAEIQEFCAVNYGVTFPLFAKIEVNGPGADPLYHYLRSNAPVGFGSADGVAGDAGDAANDIQWNFTKFLVDKGGSLIKRYEPAVTPEAIGSEIETLL